MASLKPIYRRSSDLRHPIEDEFAQIAWGADFGPRGDSGAAAPMYTLVDRSTMVPKPRVNHLVGSEFLTKANTRRNIHAHTQPVEYPSGKPLVATGKPLAARGSH